MVVTIELDETHALFPMTQYVDDTQDKYDWVVPHLADVVISNHWMRNKVSLKKSDLDILKYISNMSRVNSKHLEGFLRWFDTLESPDVQISKIPKQVRRIVMEVGDTYLIRIGQSC
jgi:hypothetical protein